FVREENGATRVEDHGFRPCAWVPAGTPDAAPLAGGHFFGALREFEDWKSLQAERGGAAFALSDPVQQFLTRTGRTLFKGMTFESLRRLQIHVETLRHGDSPHADAERDPLAVIALADGGGWEECLRIETGSAESERAAIERLGAIIEERDPDVIEGHHLFKVALPCLAARARHCKLRLRWGRGGGPLTVRPSRLQIAEKTIQYPRYGARGRHLVDTFVLAQYYDIGTRELEGFSLRDVAAHFGLTDPSDDASGRARETRSLAAALGASYFVQAQIFPYNYQDVIVRGNATKIDALFLREYLRRGHSLPATPDSRAFEGGYTDVFFTGVAQNVWHCDVASLYPSVMLRFGLLPANDTLGVFGGLLQALRTFRLEAKRRLREAESGPSRARNDAELRHLSALQNTFKILINSFYGYLGFAQGHFADYAAAAAVTARGRELLRAMVEWLRGAGANVIEIDTDGIYFQPPPGATVATLDAGIRAILPDGIEVEFDRQYAAMFSYKAKNYALLGLDGRITLKGAALKSRGMEPYLREYLERVIGHILRGESAALPALRAECEAAIRGHAWPVGRLAKTEALQDSLASYRRKIAASSRNRSAAFELALASGRDYQAGDPVTYYITGAGKKVVAYEAARMVDAWRPDARDENVEYYVAKLNELHAKFAAVVPGPDAQGALL
ncbi:MAG: DNA polymerase domain-containing protein, partial [Terrimicrobiaceae bacterium]|nr:DNA polymerase domain-containing protein [Terrimicrobiaceae bacterium]